MTSRLRRLALVALSVSLLAAACGGDDSSSTTTAAPPDTVETTVESTMAPTTEPPATEPPATEPPETAAPTTEAPVEVLRILVTNDDGVGAEGIDAVVRALVELPDVEITVIAPLENQSGSSDNVSEMPPPVTDAQTASGFPAQAVAGFPADSVLYALGYGVLVEPPHLVVAGLNEGQNMGPVISASGTVGAARTAVREGIPALATSQQFADEPAFEVGARYVAEWVEANRDALLAGTLTVQTFNMNVPSCPEGEPRSVIEVPVLDDLGDRDYVAPSDCVGDVETPDNDVDGLARGFVTLSTIAPD
jgi:5'-nucleotidase